MSIKCPKCAASITATPDDLGMVTCSKCGARLRSRAQVKVTVKGGAAAPPVIDPAAAAPPDFDSLLSRIDSSASGDETIRPGGLPKLRRTAAAPPPPAAGPATLDSVLAEIRAVRRAQEEMLALLRGRALPDEGGAPPELSLTPEPEEPEPAPQPRVEERRSVLVIDDEIEANPGVVHALRALGAAVRTAADGNAALAAIAREKPNVIVLELALGGSLPGRDVVNMIKATMEWVDIPIVAHTRLEVADLDEARQVHGADEWIPKRAGSEIALATRIGALLTKP